MKEKEYRDLKAINYSLIKAYETHPEYARQMWYEEGEKSTAKHFEFGSAFDCMITRPSDFDKEYYIMTHRLSDSVKAMADEFVRLANIADDAHEFLDMPKMFLKARTNVQFQTNWKDETVVAKHYDEVRHYLDEVMSHKDKTILSTNDYNQIVRMEKVLKDSPFYSMFFTPDTELQKAVIFDLEGIKCKALLDGYNKKKNLFDVKTYDSRFGSFLVNFYKYVYAGQLSFYRRAVNENVGTYIIACDKAEILPPTVYVVTDEILRVAEHGGYLGGKHYAGFRVQAHKLDTCIKTDKWDDVIIIS